MPIGALISAGASLIGGALNRRANRAAEKRRLNFERTRIQTVAADAKKAGIHPLSALGVAAGYQNPYGSAPSGSTLGDGIAAAGDIIGRSVPTKTQKAKDAQAATLNEKQAQLLDAQILESRSRTNLNSANAKRALLGPNSPVDPFGMRQENALIKVKLENGDIVRIPNPDIYDISPSELVTARGIIEGARVVEKGIEKSKTRDAVSGKQKKRRSSMRNTRPLIRRPRKSYRSAF